jgi:hypothetical protein
VGGPPGRTNSESVNFTEADLGPGRSHDHGTVSWPSLGRVTTGVPAGARAARRGPQFKPESRFKFTRTQHGYGVTVAKSESADEPAAAFTVRHGRGVPEPPGRPGERLRGRPTPKARSAAKPGRAVSALQSRGASARG